MNYHTKWYVSDISTKFSIRLLYKQNLSMLLSNEKEDLKRKEMWKKLLVSLEG